MPRLLIATGIFHPESGGPATYLYHLLPHLQERGYEVHVLTYGQPSEADADYLYPVTRVSREGGFLWRSWRYWVAAFPLLSWADGVYQHTLTLPLMQPRWVKRTPRVIKIVGDQVWERS
ncbi:MAG: glycosyltransferase, partial [Chloroflexota bacterium]